MGIKNAANLSVFVNHCPGVVNLLIESNWARAVSLKDEFTNVTE